jgi:cytochrome c553
MGDLNMNSKLRFTIIASALMIPLASTAFAAGDAAAGKEKAATCTSCHGANGEGNGQPNSKIAGMMPDKFTAAIAAYKSGEKKNMMMEMFAKKLSDADVADLAAYYASLK